MWWCQRKAPSWGRKFARFQYDCFSLIILFVSYLVLYLSTKYIMYTKKKFFFTFPFFSLFSNAQSDSFGSVGSHIMATRAMDYKVSCSQIPRHAFAGIRTHNQLVGSPNHSATTLHTLPVVNFKVFHIVARPYMKFTASNTAIDAPTPKLGVGFPQKIFV
jgi:hypothetical protein